MTATAQRHAMGAVDAIWLHMDRPENLLVIDTLMWFDGTLRVDRLRAVVTERLLGRFPVFRMRPAEALLSLATPHWVEDRGFDLDQHLLVRRLPAPGDDAALRRFVEKRISQPLDRAHPLWQFWLVHGYRPDDGSPAGSVLLARIHHAVADGIALAHVLLSLTDPMDGPAAQPSAADPGPATDDDTSTAPRSALPAALHLFADVARLVRPEAALDALSLVRKVGVVVDKLLLGSLPPTPLSGTPGVAKHAVWSRPYDLAAVKATGRATGSTVNDVLLAAVGGAVAGYLAARGATPQELTAMVPVDVRGGVAPPPELGNRFALVLFPLASGDADAQTRLTLTRQRMAAIKASPEAAITFGTIGVIGRTHPEVERLLVNFLSAKAIGVLTNVIGPSQRRALAGVPMTAVLGWVPQAAEQTLGICIFSYAGTVRIGFRADAAVVQAPEELVAGFDRALGELVGTPAVEGRS